MINSKMAGFVKVMAIFLLFESIIQMISGCSPKKEERSIPTAEKSIDSALIGSLNEKWNGDLDGILKGGRCQQDASSGSYSKTDFTIVNGHQQGFEYELLHEYEIFLNKRVARREVQRWLSLLPFQTINLSHCCLTEEVISWQAKPLCNSEKRLPLPTPTFRMSMRL